MEDRQKYTLWNIDEWEFRGEGNHNLVIANKTGMVLRMRKSTEECGPTTKPDLSSDSMESFQRCSDYGTDVILPLIGANFVEPGEVVRLPEEFVHQVNLKLKDHTDATVGNYALRMADAGLIKNPSSVRDDTSTFCVEIRPKFVAHYKTNTRVGQQSDPSDIECVFCGHHPIKEIECGGKEMSGYCPVDFFSGDRNRMKYALRELLKMSNQKTKIFKNGDTVFTNGSISALNNLLMPYFGADISTTVDDSPTSILIDLVIQALLFVPRKDDSHNVVDTTGADIPLLTCKRSGSPDGSNCMGPPLGCILHRLLCVHQLGNIELEDIHTYYRRAIRQLCRRPLDRYKWHLHDGPYDNIWGLGNNIFTPTSDDGSIQYAVDKLKKYLIFLTCESASSLVSIKPVPKSDEAHMDEESLLRDKYGRCYEFSVRLIDFEPKPFHRIGTYILQEKWRQHAVAQTTTMHNIMLKTWHVGFVATALYIVTQIGRIALTATNKS